MHYQPVSPNRGLSRNQTIILFSGCAAGFIVGLILLGVGWTKFTTEPEPISYFWSVNFCQVNGTQQWVGMQLRNNESCPHTVTLESGTTQSFTIRNDLFKKSLPYLPVVYATNKASGDMMIDHTLNGEQFFAVNDDFKAMEVTRFASCGGKEITIYRDGPLYPVEGDYITTDCNNPQTGCRYEPGRSLDKYNFDVGYFEVQQSIPEGGLKIVVNSFVLRSEANVQMVMPEVYLYYEIAGRDETQDFGLGLLAFGVLLVDAMPGTLYFVFSRKKGRPLRGNELVIGSSNNRTNVR